MAIKPNTPSINIERYVNITSGVGAGQAVKEREPILRILTNSMALPPDSFVELTDVASVRTLFGVNSKEFKMAQFYFGFISKSVRRPRKISFARAPVNGAQPLILGASTKGLRHENFIHIEYGVFGVLFDGTEYKVSKLDFSGVSSLEGVAFMIMEALRETYPDDTTIQSSSIHYDAINYRFVMQAGTVSSSTLEPLSLMSSESELMELMKMDKDSATISAGTEPQTITDILINTAMASSNFYSFVFTDNEYMTMEQKEEAAAFAHGSNVKFAYYIPVTSDDADKHYEMLHGFSGVGLVLSEVAGEYPELFPAMVTAATDYTSRNATQSYMYQMEPRLSASVRTTSDADRYDSIRVNYMGLTQTAGQPLQFFQRGTLLGGASMPVDMNTYANETWFKDRMNVAFMSIFLNLPKVPASAKGIAIGLNAMEAVIAQALLNGVISVGKELNATQREYVYATTLDANAATIIERVGYWRGMRVQEVTTDTGVTEYRLVYTLLYAKDDTIRAVDGFHTLI